MPVPISSTVVEFPLGEDKPACWSSKMDMTYYLNILLFPIDDLLHIECRRVFLSVDHLLLYNKYYMYRYYFLNEPMGK
jgi:hypothetical protein